MNNNRFLEPDIKIAIINKLRDVGDLGDHSLVINEFTIDYFARRVDLVVLIRGKLIAFEVKSESDNLSRLDGQLKKYSEYFDKVIVVAAKKHIEKVKNTAQDNVGIWEFSDNKFKIHRRGKLSFIRNYEKLSQLMTLEDFRKLVSGSKNNIFSREDLLCKANKLPISKFRVATHESLYKRFCMTSALFFKKIGSEQAEVNDLTALSRYTAPPIKIKSEKPISWLIKNNDPLITKLLT
ncbi:hypothetical protein CXF76_00115 [Pseudoalteromonas sp. 78C3]|uniref:sce7726 family protein n=1 Tax=Pseudoalteromonas sp. 78C3 TaxID=2058300 RepID=UPI000C3349A2|nr:sce7726 family protein [Pseudoalteromonas sp. 78C3]PKH93779.1 hypothetical protein CXF76_00115 [Pseudoalteromonas sp. 78C3]